MLRFFTQDKIFLFLPVNIGNHRDEPGRNPLFVKKHGRVNTAPYVVAFGAADPVLLIFNGLSPLQPIQALEHRFPVFFQNKVPRFQQFQNVASGGEPAAELLLEGRRVIKPPGFQVAVENRSLHVLQNQPVTLFAGRQFILRFFPGGDVDQNAVKPIVTVAVRCPARFVEEPNDLPVPAQHPVDHFSRIVPADTVFKLFFDDFPILWVNHIQKPVAERTLNFRTRISGNPAEAVADEAQGHKLVVAVAQHPARHIFRQGFQLFRLFALLAQGTSCQGNVFGNSAETVRPAALGAKADAVSRPDMVPVFLDQPQFGAGVTFRFDFSFHLPPVNRYLIAQNRIVTWQTQTLYFAFPVSQKPVKRAAGIQDRQGSVIPKA